MNNDGYYFFRKTKEYAHVTVALAFSTQHGYLTWTSCRPRVSSYKSWAGIEGIRDFHFLFTVLHGAKRYLLHATTATTTSYYDQKHSFLLVGEEHNSDTMACSQWVACPHPGNPDGH